MAMKGLLAAACAGLVLTACQPGFLLADDPASAVDATLAVQTAMQQAREYLLRNDARSAVEVLEGQLARINGNPTYLTMLRDAYRTHIKELRLANQEEAAQVYVRRLNILEPSAAVSEPKPNRAVAVFQKAFGLGQTHAPPAAAMAAAPSPAPKVRGYKEEDDDPFRAPRPDKQKAAQDALSQAEQEFANRKFREAGTLFDQAHQAGQSLAEASRERWAYCKLHRVVEQLNQPVASPAYPELESEVRLALSLAPRLDYGKTLLREIEARRGTSAAASPRREEAPQPVVVRHGERTGDGWATAETANFRIFHNQSRELAEQAARIAERTRVEMQRKWFGDSGETWSPRCDLYLHATAHDYNRVTGAPGNSPGHSSFRMDGGRLVSRRIDLHCDNPNMLIAVLPHETTHVVLAGNFGGQPVPRWMDEGVAVLTEPRDKIDLHLKNLPRHRQDGQLFAVRQLMQMNDYPDPRYIGPFYAQSVSLVEFLASEKGPQVFTQFVREGLRNGYEPALQRHYGYASFAELEQRWNRHAFRDEAPTGVAQANP